MNISSRYPGLWNSLTNEVRTNLQEVDLHVSSEASWAVMQGEVRSSTAIVWTDELLFVCPTTDKVARFSWSDVKTVGPTTSGSAFVEVEAYAFTLYQPSKEALESILAHKSGIFPEAAGDASLQASDVSDGLDSSTLSNIDRKLAKLIELQQRQLAAVNGVRWAIVALYILLFLQLKVLGVKIDYTQSGP